MTTKPLTLFIRPCPPKFVASNTPGNANLVTEYFDMMRRSGVRFPGRSNRTQYSQRLATAAMFLRSCAAQTLRRGGGSRNSLWRNKVSIMRIRFRFSCHYHQWLLGSRLRHMLQKGFEVFAYDILI